MRTHSAKRLLSIGCAFLLSATAIGQSYLNDTGSPTYAVTIPVENGFIDLSNGNLHLEFPIASIPQRGRLATTEKLTYDSRIWAWHNPGYSYQWLPDNVYGTSLSGGWRFYNGRSQGTIRLLSNGGYYNPCYDGNGNYMGTDSGAYWQIAYVDDAGVTHPTAATSTFDDNEGCPDGSTWSSTTTYAPGLATDGSGYYVALDGSGNPYVIDDDGNEVYPSTVDRYGNYLSTDGANNTKDDTGRVPVIVTHPSGTVTWYDVLAPTNPITSGTRVRYIVTTSSISVATSFGALPSEWTGTLNPITRIELPDGSSYSFTYDGYGELNKVTLPTDGIINYTYNNFTDSTGEINRWLYSRQIGTGSLETLTPAVTGCTGCQQVTHHKPNGDETVYSVNINNGAWTTGVATYTGSATASSPKQLTQASFSNIYANPCTIFGPYLGCAYGWSYVLGSLTTTKLFSDSGGSPIYTQTFTNNFLPGKPAFTKTWDYTLSPSGSVYSPPGGTPTSEIDYAYTSPNYWYGPWDIQTVKTLDNSGSQVALTTYGYTGSATTASGVTQHGPTPTTPEYLHTVTQWENVGSSPVTTYSMDDTGEVISVQDPNGNSPTTMTYQCFNSLPLATKPLGSTTYQTTYGYDCSSGAITSVLDPNGYTTAYTYDSVGRLHAITYPDGGSTSYSYVAPTEVDTTVAAYPDPDIVTQSYLDVYGRPDHTTQNGVTSATTYDANGRVDCVENPHTGLSTADKTCIQTAGGATGYDGLNRALVKRMPDGSTQQLEYSVDATSLKALAIGTDAAGNQTKSFTNALGQLTKVVEPGPSSLLSTNYTYDALGNLTTINQLGNGSTDAPRVRTFTYDSLSRLLCASNPENSSASCPGSATSSYTSGTVGYGYDADGNVTSVKDARGVTTTNIYDALGRLNWKFYSDGTNPAGFGYDGNGETGSPVTPAVYNAIGRLSHTSNEVNAAANYSYDSMGRLSSEAYCIPSDCSYGIKASASYDLAGNMKDFTYPDGRKIQQTFDTSGRLNYVNYANWNGTTVNFPYISDITYSPLGGMSSIAFGNGVHESISYNNRSQPCEIAASYPATPGSSTMAFASDKQYYFSASGTGGVCGTVSGNNGNVWSIDDALNSTAKKQQFGFDSLNRLTSATRADNQFNYTYNIDSFGNMQQQNNLIYNPPITFPGTSNQIQVGSSYSYDAAGNQTDTGSSSGGHHYTYDALGHVTQVDYGTTATYTYDALGSRIRKDTATYGAREYLSFGGQLMAELVQGVSWTDYIYANGKKIAKADSAEGLLQVSGNAGGGGQWQWYDTNQLHGYVIHTGDHLDWRQYGTSGAHGGMFVSTNTGANSIWTLNDSNGQASNQSGVTGQWDQRNVDLSSFAGGSITGLGVGLDVGTVGTATIDFADIAIVHSDGSVSTAFNSQSIALSPISGNTMGSPSGTYTIAQPAGAAATQSAHYYLADHLGSSRIEFSSGGWPVWGEDYAPYGQEVSPAPTSNHNRFTSYERDPETSIAGGTGDDYAQARYYSSTIQGRFTSPDPYLGSMNISNPQSFNRYTYAMNNPVKFSDPSGLECVWDDGSYDSADDPQTGAMDEAGNHTNCSSAGGTWIDHGYFSGNGLGDWSKSGNDDLAAMTVPTVSVTTSSDWSLFNAVANSLGDAQYLGSAVLQGVGNYTVQDVFTWATWQDTPNGPFHPMTNLSGTLLPYYHGNYCGAGGMGAPIDSEDAACLVHDFLYNKYGFTPGSNLSSSDPGLQAINQMLCDTSGSTLISAYFNYGIAIVNGRRDLGSGCR